MHGGQSINPAGGLSVWLAAVGLAAGLYLVPPAPAHAATGTEAAAAEGLPTILSTRDLDRYQRIFELQRNGNNADADREIRGLGDKLLLGHVLHQRYTQPGNARPGYAELAAWLSSYSELPGAEQVYQLALRTKPRTAKAPKAPVGADAGDFAPEAPPPRTGRGEPLSRSRDRNGERLVEQAEAQITAQIRRSRPDLAEKQIERREIRDLLSPSEFDDWRLRIAAAHFFLGDDDKKVLALAEASAKRSRARVPQADWIAGLAAWRLGRMDNAAHHFEELAYSSTAGIWEKAAGAWWAGRVALKLRQPQEMTRLLKLAAQQPRTFYGILAAQQLSQDAPYTWQQPPLAVADTPRLLALPAIRRAMALNEVGETVRAEREIARLFPRANDQLAAGLLALASRLQTPAAALRLANAWRASKGEAFDAALYPLPPWQPDGGFVVDRALIFAFMRQESGFNARAMSPVGATGLMQLMPRTAGFVAGDSSLHRTGQTGRARLFAPEYNIELGQRYLQHLLEQPQVKGNLFLLAAAYNGGPGNLQRWVRDDRYDNDPLLFIETIPAPETRLFVQRVLTNYWMYQARLNQPLTSLVAAMDGDWPLYTAQDNLPPMLESAAAEVSNAGN